MGIEVIPVIDVMKGLVVHAIAGKRELYKPLTNSSICSSPEPREAIDSLWRLGFRRIYIADLDSIMGCGSNEWVVDLAIMKGFRVLADLGRRGIELTDRGLLEYVIGTEYLDYPSEVDLVRNRAMSIDIYGDRVVFRNASVSLEKAVVELVKPSPTKILLIDLSRVGTLTGLNTKAIALVKGVFKGELIVGGGVRSEEDVLYLKSLGVSGALIATAIHKGIVVKALY
ncbi:MAG: HisA/HisF-related TIM barrel protein [Sulfolobales archaeon]|nr:HisA/HisF-related TIM barrel protein [Sulfolobales archaeon]MCX8198426.1 HisA/HisF-related TIM barrel protein [Sulfolobales archaeon]MDW8169500.1 HisA/HisF-related TIM barrel protein [Desulfurococcaceae archaeon]